MSEAAHKPAADLARMIAAREISARELLDVYAERIEQHNPALNAIVTLDEDAAQHRAKEADEATARGESWGPLHGLPITIKDSFEVAGMTSTGGALPLKDHVPAKDAEPVARLRQAGANIIGKTNVPEYAGDWQSYNDLFGRTNNPWNLERTPGGSSGGAVAALSAGLVAAEIGSDIGGSIRVPANFCGLFGHKPSFGTVPNAGHIPPAPHGYGTADLGVGGPFGRSVEDLVLMMAIMSGARPSEPALSISSPAARQIKRVAVWAEDDFAPTDSELVDAVKKAGQALTGAGVQVDFGAKPDFAFQDSHAIYLTILSSIISDGWHEKTLAFMADHATKTPETAIDDLTLQARGSVLTYSQYLGLNSRREEMKAKWAEFFQTYDAVICPVTAVTAFPHDTERRVPDRRISVNGEERPYMELLRWAGLATVSHLPASAAPTGLSNDGLPLGVQIIGPYQEDLTCFAVARLLEQAFGGFTPPPLS